MINMYTNLQKKLYKQIYRNFFPKKMHHNKNFWPFYRVVRDGDNCIKSIYFKGKQLPLVNQWMPKKKNIMLVATGPSVKKIDKRLFEHDDFDYIGVNGAIALEYCKFKYYCIFDPGFVKNRSDLVKQILQEVNYLFVSAECLNLILMMVDLEDIKCRFKVLERVNLENEIEYFMAEKQKIKDNLFNSAYMKGELGFSKDINKYVFDYHTIAYVALQVSCSLNYDNIYMIGVDFTNLDEPRFYEDLRNKQDTELNKFIDIIEQSFFVASKYADQQGFKIFNLSKQSILNCFVKIDF